MAILDTNMQCLAVSGQWISFYELENNSYVGKSHYATFRNIDEKWKVLYSKALQGVDEQCKDNNLLKDLASGQIANVKVEKRYVHKNGSIIDVLVVATMLKDSQGKPLHFITQIEDITKRKNTEEKLLISEKKYRSIFKNF